MPKQKHSIGEPPAGLGIEARRAWHQILEECPVKLTRKHRMIVRSASLTVERMRYDECSAPLLADLGVLLRKMKMTPSTAPAKRKRK